MRMRQPAVFLDKDGTIIEDVPFNVDTRKIRWMPKAVEGLQHLAGLGFRLVIITNQQGIAHGCFSEEEIDAVHSHLRRMFAKEGLELAGFYYCPHHPQAKIEAYRKACRCRKPYAGMVKQACRALDIDIKRSWFIGDILNDVECGNRAGCRSVLINNGHETEWELSPCRTPYASVLNLEQAARLIARDYGLDKRQAHLMRTLR